MIKLHLEELENRLSPATFSVDFSSSMAQGSVLVPTTLNVKFSAQDGTVYQRAFPMNTGEPASVVRDRVVNAMTVAGWNVVTAGDAVFQVQGHGALGVNSPTETADAYEPKLRQSVQPKISVLSNINVDSNDKLISFDNMDQQNQGLSDNATFDLTIGSTDVLVALSSGTTPQQAADALFSQLHSLGYSVTETGSVVDLNSSATSVNASWLGSGGPAAGVGGLFVNIEIQSLLGHNNHGIG